MNLINYYCANERLGYVDDLEKLILTLCVLKKRKTISLPTVIIRKIYEIGLDTYAYSHKIEVEVENKKFERIGKFSLVIDQLTSFNDLVNLCNRKYNDILKRYEQVNKHILVSVHIDSEGFFLRKKDFCKSIKKIVEKDLNCIDEREIIQISLTEPSDELGPTLGSF